MEKALLHLSVGKDSHIFVLNLPVWPQRNNTWKGSKHIEWNKYYQPFTGVLNKMKVQSFAFYILCSLPNFNNHIISTQH